LWQPILPVDTIISTNNLTDGCKNLNRAITKYEINRIRLLLIKEELFHQFDSYNEFRQQWFPLVTLGAFRQWFKKPYFISDHRLCLMEEALGISPSKVKARLKKEFNLTGQALQAAKGITFNINEHLPS